MNTQKDKTASENPRVCEKLHTLKKEKSLTSFQTVASRKMRLLRSTMFPAQVSTIGRLTLVLYKKKRL